MTRLQPRAVIFDLFHTLTSFEVSKAPGRSVPEILGIDPETWLQVWTSDLYDYALGKVDVSVPIRALARRFRPEITEDLITEAIAVRRTRFRYVITNIESETLDGLSRLRAAGLRLGLISNCGCDEIEFWHESPLAPLFDTTVFSCQVGLRKPDTRIYHLAAERLQTQPADTLFVGNGGTDELAGARRAGMIPILLTRHLEVISPQRISQVAADACYQVRTVSELADRLLAEPAGCR